MDTYEYGYIYIENGAFVGMRPAAHSTIAAVVGRAPIRAVLENLASCGWERGDNVPIPLVGKVQIKIRRPVLEEPKDIRSLESKTP